MDTPMHGRPTSLVAELRTRRERWLSAPTGRGLAIILAFSAINAFRRNANSRFLWEDPVEWWIDFGNATLTGLFVSIPLVLAVVAAVNLLSLRGWRLATTLAPVVTLSTLAGTALLIAWEGVDDGYTLMRAIGSTWLRYVPLGLLFAGGYVYFRRKAEGLEAMRQFEADRAQLEERMTEARLSALQAQIEPHFLFNTLATVRRLYKKDVLAAGVTLDNLMRYLTVALPQMRETESTLGREAMLAEAYLNIHRIRMARRLEFELDIPAHLRSERLPPMMMLTLVENAIKHGLNPLPHGGFIRISARTENGKLRVAVEDSGRGFIKTSGGGTGLANLRARLSAEYGTEASLALTLNEPRGVTATITLPATAAHMPATGA